MIRTMNASVLQVKRSLEIAIDWLWAAEKCQSEMDPIEGPGSGEWQILRDRIAQLERDLQAAMDEPGSLEARENEIDTWNEKDSFYEVDSLTIRPQNSGIWINFEFAGFKPVRVYTCLTFDFLGEEFVELGILHATPDGTPKDERVYVDHQGGPALEFAQELASLESKEAWSGGDLRDFYATDQAKQYLDMDLKDVSALMVSVDEFSPEGRAAVKAIRAELAKRNKL